jgi:hypothetical protein
MADVTETGLRSAVKALVDTVAPAIDAKDPLAREQLRLVVDYLEFVGGRLDFMYPRDRFELRHHLAMGRTLQRLAADAVSASTAGLLAAAIAAGEQCLGRLGAGPAELKAAGAALAAAIRELVREAVSFDAPRRRSVERAVLDASDERVAFDRAWYLPLGFDPASGEVARLADLLADPAAPVARAP